jgi:hypothetical protein
MLWDCRFCGTQKLLGVTHRHCPNCGAAQDPAWRYFPAESDMIALENHQYVGADKICPACSQPNSAAALYCAECGADLVTGKVATTQAARELGTSSADADTRHDVVQDQFVADMQRIGAMPAPSGGLRKKHWIMIGAAITAVLLVIAGAIWAFTYRKNVSAKITSMRWEHVIEIEDYQARHGEGWDETVPGGAYNEHCSDRQRGTRRVEDGSHQECRDVDQGDGSMRRDCHQVTDYRNEPVYDRWCTYTFDSWAHARDVTASGGENDPMSWPTFTLANPGGRYGDEREGSHHENYRVEFTDNDGKKRSCEFDSVEKWQKFSIGAEVQVEVGIRGGPDCNTLKLKN